MKPSILFILHMPPPVHGAAMMGKYIHDSKVIMRHLIALYQSGHCQRYLRISVKWAEEANFVFGNAEIYT